MATIQQRARLLVFLVVVPWSSSLAWNTAASTTPWTTTPPPTTTTRPGSPLLGMAGFSTTPTGRRRRSSVEDCRPIILAPWSNGRRFFARTTETSSRSLKASERVTTTPDDFVATKHGEDMDSSSTITSSFSSTLLNLTPSQTSSLLYTPLLDFAQTDTLDKIGRLDDAIMGGISTSSVIYCNSSNTPQHDQGSSSSSFAKWFGVCREDGGGFCGWRTNPFAQPLKVDGYSGVYLKCRFTSDTEPHRRIWKFSTRTRPDRGEQLYQAQFTVPMLSSDNNEWSIVQIPFEQFRLVRGPRMVSNAPLLNVSLGLYQLGMAMSKFAWNSNKETTSSSSLQVLDNFRPGYFALDMKEIGVYQTVTNEATTAPSSSTPTTSGQELLLAVSSSSSSSTTTSISDHSTPPPQVVALSKAETNQKRPWYIQNVLLPIVQLVFFSEQSQRRKSAMKLLTTKRSMTRLQALQWGFQLRRRQFGTLSALSRTSTILVEDSSRLILSTGLKVALFYPLRLVGFLLRQLDRKRKVAQE